ncbi:MAG: N-acetyl-gamma-glutamyl-phosphate reductase [Desulfobacteraceae bacterium]|nr:N-acetyl-gamma-glutamyl-phosphate reductase [Desulfobacteraceae bacterium]MCB9495162.1 N-acetyl-gamma-glutamyl-phosphate reductase [Desulfobacteraceae bacterium]
MIRAGIIGGTGYTGAELVRLLSFHPEAELTYITSRQYAGQIFSDIYPALRTIADIEIEEFDLKKAQNRCDVVFTALPHKIPMEIIPGLIENKIKVVDLSADFRFRSIKSYEDYYCEHKAAEYLEKSVYGLCEVNSHLIRNASLVGNPGCYPTCSLLGIIPFIKHKKVNCDDIIIDAKSGVSGAGRGLSEGTHFCSVDEGFKAYKVMAHRHRPEIEEKIEEIADQKAGVCFTPHLIPAVRGMLATIYMRTSTDTSESELRNILCDYYKNSRFVRVLGEGEFPNIKNVSGTNFCDIGIKYDNGSKRLIIVSVIDNLVKGASGQAIQNMNLMFGLDEAKGLMVPPQAV